jgi:glutaredoxin-like YruB-family protein
MKKLTIYSTPTCHYCDEAKKFFDQFGVKYNSIDVSKDIEARKKMVEVSKQMGVPVITVNKEVFVGFSYEVKNKLIELLDIKLN